jgi:hypothetical protein
MVVDNSLWIKFNLIKKTVEQLEKMDFYRKSRGYGECYNYIDPDFLKIEVKTAINEAYNLFTKEISNSKEIFHSILNSGFQLELLPCNTTCKLFWIDLARDFLNSDAPTEIKHLWFGFRMNNELAYSYEDDQLRGICAHIRKRDGTHGQKLFRMYLKAPKIIRYESCFDKKSAGKAFPIVDLSLLKADQLKKCIEPLNNLTLESFNQIHEDSKMEEQLSTESSRYEILKCILNILDGNLGKNNILHISNLIEYGYIQSRVVQDYRLLKKLRDNKIIIPAHEHSNRKRHGQYRLNRDFLSTLSS